MADLSEDELSAWEILPDAELLYVSPPQSTCNNGNSRVMDEVSDGTSIKSPCSSNPILSFSEIEDKCKENASMVSPEWADPCLESRLGKRVIDGVDSGDVTLEELSGSIDSSVSESGKIEGDVGEVLKEEKRDLGIELHRDVSVVERATSKERAWWKFPLELIKVSVLRAKPFWSLSLGVLAIGVILLGKRWYKAKGKPRSTPTKISLEEKKKVLPLMIQATGLNEALPVVRHVPSATRASLLPAGATPWPLIGLK